jgi:thioredoxin reductase
MSFADAFDVAIVGGGPAGLSAAIVLGRACRKVVVLDSGKPRNYAARSVNCFLGVDGASPAALRHLGREQAQRYGVQFLDATVVSGRRLTVPPAFELSTAEGQVVWTRKLLLTTGVRDILPDIENIERFYGRTVHHCPYCDGWEHRGQRLVALGEHHAASKLAHSLQVWSPHVTACSTGSLFTAEELRQFDRARINHRKEPPVRLEGDQETMCQIVFTDGPPLPCDAVFFSSDQAQQSNLPQMLGCRNDDEGLVHSGDKQSTGVEGLFLAGDADGDVQFAVVAAAEGAIAATEINKQLQNEKSPAFAAQAR